MEKMKRMYSRILKTLLTAAMFVMLIGVTASAEDVYVDMQLNENGVYVASGVNVDTSANIYHKLTVNSSGLLTVGANEIYVSSYSGNVSYYGMYVQLYNSKMKLLDIYDSGEYVNAVNEDVAVYGVKKGTYYIKVSGEQNYAIAASFEKTTNKGGTSKKKATTLKHNRTTSGIMPAGEKSSATDWYKFKVTKSKKLRLNISTTGNGYFKFYLYGPSYKNGCYIDSLWNEKGTYYSINSLTRKKLKVKTGTYYIKVVRSTKKSSGKYTLRWKLV